MRTLLSALLVLMLPGTSYAMCPIGDATCRAAEKAARALEDMKFQREMEQIDRDLERTRDRARNNQPAVTPPPPPTDCSKINPLSSFSRGYQSGGLLGAFGNIEEEKQRCAEAAKARPAPTVPAAPVTVPSKIPDPLAEPQGQKYIAELRQQAEFDPALPKKTCEYQRSLIETDKADMIFLLACLAEGHLEIDPERMKEINARTEQFAAVLQEAATRNPEGAKKVCAEHAAQADRDVSLITACIRTGFLSPDYSPPEKSR